MVMREETRVKTGFFPFSKKAWDMEYVKPENMK